MSEHKLSAALIGLGDAAQHMMLHSLKSIPEIRLVAACDTSRKRVEQVRAQHGIDAMYTDPARMIADVSPNLVVIATPPLTHFDLAKLAVSQECHIFCEKPFMPSLAEASEIIALADEHQTYIAVNNQYYQMPIYRAVLEGVNRNDYGRPFHIECWQHMRLGPEDETSWKSALAPRRVLFEFGTHVIDLICRFFEAYPEQVTARTVFAGAHAYTDGCITVRLDFPDGRAASFTLNRASHAPLRYFETRIDCEDASIRISLGGVATAAVGWNSEQGRPRLRLSLTRGGEARIERHGSSRLLATQPATAFRDATREHLATFVNAIQQGQSRTSFIERAEQVLKIMFACYQSADENGRLVSI